MIGRQGPTFDEQAPQPVAVVSGVASQAAAGRDSADQGQCDANVAELAGGHFERDGASARIDDRVDFRGATAARATNRLRFGPPFPPAAER